MVPWSGPLAGHDGIRTVVVSTARYARMNGGMAG